MNQTISISSVNATTNRVAVLRKAWQINHIAANVAGMGLLHTAIAHGIAGQHGVALTWLQFLVHTVSLFVFGTLLTLGQNKALQHQFERKTFADLSYFVVIMPAAFWLGYYTLYIPFDILFMYLTIGIINAIRLRHYFANPRQWVRQIILALLCGAMAGVGAGLATYFSFLKDIHDISADFILWTVISTVASITYASISKRFFRTSSFTPQ